MGSSYREMSEKYKNAKRSPIVDEEDTKYHKRKSKKKVKRSDHKHQYVKVLIHQPDFFSPWSVGKVCSICGRIDDREMLWGKSEKEVRELYDYPVKEVYGDDFFLKYV